uniref:YubB ferredoxin-like domain-containing protein n=1 Tax=viral metagenome TaxID=1070528 RepID=A0A6C0B9M3_9ZZZZ
MPNDCWNCMTITCENIEFAEELNSLVINELKHKEGEKYIYNETIDMLQRGTRGIIFNAWSAWNPDYEWLENLLDKYPNCWVKNEWSEEGGLAGVWIGFVKNNEKIIKDLTWDDICLEGKQFLFILEDEEEAKKEEEERQNKINKKNNIKKIIKKSLIDQNKSIITSNVLP